MRIYADLPEDILQSIDEYRNKKRYSMTRNAAIIELLEKALEMDQ